MEFFKHKKSFLIVNVEDKRKTIERIARVSSDVGEIGESIGKLVSPERRNAQKALDSIELGLRVLKTIFDATD